MAAARKSLIAPGSFLPGAGGSPEQEPDLLGRIVRNDREKHGREREQVPSPAQTNATVDTEDNDIAAAAVNTNGSDGNITSNITENIIPHARISESAHVRSNIVRNAGARQETQVHGNMPVQKVSLQDLGGADGDHPLPPATRAPSGIQGREYARKLRKSTPIPMTLRLPEKLNDYVDELAHVHRKQRILKQDLVALGIQLLVEQIDGGADLLELLEAFGKQVER